MKKIKFEYNFNTEENLIIDELAKNTSLLKQTVKILYSRGYTTKESIQKFLNAGKNNFLSPFLLSGMLKLKERMDIAKKNNEKIVIYGDYDADGISAVCILYNALTEFGVDAECFVPERSEGYGLSEENIEKIADNAFPDLIITVDCGISGYKEIEYIKDLGIDVIVTDHHELPEILPDCLIINPKLKQDYPFDNLCGAGVAFKIACALIGDKAFDLLDFAALATVADSVPLINENRDIVFEGLKLLNKNIRPSFKELLGNVKDKNITAQTLAFSLAPRINAAGRMGDAKKALQLLLENNFGEINKLAVILNSYNLERQQACEKLYNSAKQMLNKEILYDDAIILQSEKWDAGFVGIVAARLVEEFSRPAILFVNNNGVLKGSARSIEKINIFETVVSAKEYIEEFGGHSQAAGITIKIENFNNFKACINNYLEKNYTNEDYIEEVVVSEKIDFELSKEFILELAKLEPFGMQNRSPLFITEEKFLNAKRIKMDSPHITFSTKAIEMMYFNGVKNLEILKSGIKKHIVFEPNINIYNRKEYIKGYVKDVICEITNTEEDNLCIIKNNLLSINNIKEYDIKYVSTQETQDIINNLDSHYGYCFIVNDLVSLNFYNNLQGISKDVFYLSQTNLSNVILISPSNADLSLYKKVIYLDNPINININYVGEIIVNKEIKGYNFINNLNIERASLLEIFSIIKNGIKVDITNNIDLYKKLSPIVKAEEFIFATEVFEELGLINIFGGNVFVNNIKTELNNSKIYTKIKELIG